MATKSSATSTAEHARIRQWLVDKIRKLPGWIKRSRRQSGRLLAQAERRRGAHLLLLGALLMLMIEIVR